MSALDKAVPRDLILQTCNFKLQNCPFCRLLQAPEAVQYAKLAVQMNYSTVFYSYYEYCLSLGLASTIVTAEFFYQITAIAKTKIVCTASKATEKMTEIIHPWRRPRGVPFPNSLRINSPKFAAPECTHQSLENIFPAAQMHAAHPATIIQVLIPSLQLLAALP